jgi:hypothetical protein
MFRLVLNLLLGLALVLVSLSKVHASWETLLDGTSFNNITAFQTEWAYNYPWGTDHNGSARMNQTNVLVSGGIVTLVSSLTNSYEGNSSVYPYLPIRYNSGTFYLKQPITISQQYPVWDISGQFMAPSQTGTWPAFWLTGVNSWPPESDIMEFKGTTGCNQNTYDGIWQGNITTVPTASSTWHTYRLVATLENSTNVDFHYYIDGVLESQQTSSTFVGSPCWLIIDYQMEGSSGAPGPDSKTYFTMKNVIVKRENVSGVNTGPVSDGIYEALVQSTGQSLDVLSQNTATNSPVGQWAYNAGLNEQWLLTCLGGGQYSIIGRQSGRALSVLNASTTNGAIVVIEDYTGSANQRWQFNTASNGSFELANVNSGKVLEVSDNSAVAGAAIDQWSAASSAQPEFDGISTSGSNVVLAISGCVPGISYSLLSDANFGDPLTDWPVLVANNSDKNGELFFTNQMTSSVPKQFYRLNLTSTNIVGNQQWLFQSP